ncbi:MAG: DNA primase [Treponema sp.]|jgi:DNA primase|nr:DNA primase [Treponema sp.]
MGYITKATIQEVTDKIDALAVVGDYVRIEKRSGRYLGLCPFHHEKTSSFSVNPDLKLYYCFGCGKGGTIINFIMEMDKLSFPETVELLAKRFGVPVVYEHGGQLDTGMTKRIEEHAELYSRVAGSFHYVLMEKPEGRAAKAYIISRGLCNEMIDRFRLGYAPADRRWLFTFLSGKGYSPEFLASSGLFSPKYPRSSFFADRLMFPIADRQGRTVAFGGRILGGEGPKYINSPESEGYKKGQTLFAIDLAQPEIRKTREVYIAEGYMDVIALHQAGITNAVAPLGTAFTDEQAKLLRRWADQVFLIFDADIAGQNAVVKAILTCRNNGLAAGVVVPGGDPAGGKGAPGQTRFKDPADILKEAGAEVLQKRVKYTINDFEYLMDRGRALFDVSSSEGKARGVAFLFPYLQTLDSEVSRDACIGSIAAAFGVDRGAVADDYRKTALGNKSLEAVRPSPAIRMNDELFLFAVVSIHQRLYPEVRSRLAIKEIEDPCAKDIFIALEECYAHDESGMDALLSRISAPHVRNFVIERGASNEFAVNPEQLVADGIKRVEQKRLERRLDEIVMKLRIVKAEAGIGGETPLEDLLDEKMHIDAELRRLRLKEDFD